MVYIFICVNNIFSELIQRTAKEHKIVYKLMKVIPDINVCLSDAELKGLSMHTIKKYQEKGSTGSSIAITETLSSGYKIRICWFCRCWSSYIVSLLCMMSFLRVTLLGKKSIILLPQTEQKMLSKADFIFLKRKKWIIIYKNSGKKCLCSVI